MNTQHTPTPIELVNAAEKYFDVKVGIDLAALPENAKAPIFLSEELDSLKMPWHRLTYPDAYGFLNPQFKDLRKLWVPKCIAESNKRARFITVWPLNSDHYTIPVYQNAEVCIVHGRVWPNVRNVMLCKWGPDVKPSVHGASWDKKKKILIKVW